MATGYGSSSSRNRNYDSESSVNRSSSRDDYSPPRSSNSYKHISYNQQDSTDLEDMTMEVVNDFKRAVQNKIRERTHMSEPIVELTVANIRHEKYPDQCDFTQWKRNLPRDIQKCPDSILRVSMAYGNDPQEIKSIIQTKMNQTNLNVNSTDPSLNNIIDPLKRLKRELDNNRQPNLFLAVRNIDDRDINRATRLFFSETQHFTPGLREYTFTDAQNAVEAIRQTTYELDDPQILLPILKTCQEVKDTIEYLNNLSISKKPNESPTKSSRFHNDDRTTSNSAISSNNDNASGFHYRPMHNPYQDPSQPSGRSGQPDNRSRDEPIQSPPRHNLERK